MLIKKQKKTLNFGMTEVLKRSQVTLKKKKKKKKRHWFNRTFQHLLVYVFEMLKVVLKTFLKVLVDYLKQ